MSADLGRIPATIVTGFLGAGKTTLIRHLLQNPGGRKIALIVNEFGDVGFDGQVLADCGSEACGADDIIELANGCICCTVADDFLPAMEKILGRAVPPDHIVIETSGLALPQPLVKAFAWPSVNSRVTVDGVVTVVDASAVAEGRVASDEAKLAEQRAKDLSLEHDDPVEELFEDQLRCADLIVISKTDLVDAAGMARVEKAIAADSRPEARTVRVANGNFPADIFLGQSAAAETDVGNRKSHHELAGEEHDHDDFDTFVLHVTASNRAVFETRVRAAMAIDGVLRIKGLVAIDGRAAPLAVQAVGPRVETWFVPDAARKPGLVIIGLKGLDRGVSSALCKAPRNACFMHLLKGQPRTLTGDAEPVDLGQSPGDIVILSAADTEICGLAVARRALGANFPSVRLANWMALAHPYSIDVYAEKILAQAKLVVVRLLGGASYWPYGLDEAVRLARANSSKLAVILGDGSWDSSLAAYGTVSEAEAQKLWAYLVEGGSENLTNALRYCAHLIGEGNEPDEARELPSAGIYARVDAVSTPSGATAAIVFYRALMQSGQTEPVDALCNALEERGVSALPLYVSSLKAKEDAAFVAAALTEHQPAVVLNATAFALSQPGGEFAGTVLDGGLRPVLQIALAGVSEEAWAGSTRGLSPADLTMNVVLPEMDGRIISRAVSFKEAGELDPVTECRPIRYKPKPDRIAFVADLAARWARLRAKPNAEKRVAIVLSNYPNKDGRIANGVGLDAPASTANVLKAMRSSGYSLDGAPESGAALMDLLLAGPTNARSETLSQSERAAAKQPGEGLRGSRLGSGVATPHPTPSGPPSPSGRRGAAPATLSLEDYASHFSRLPETVQAAIQASWGEPHADPFVENDAFVLPAHRFGNAVIGIQPARGYNIDPKTSYHDPDLVPPHGYFAFYSWLRESFGADALVHMGKHGNLEWLPGKALALSENCFPEAVLGPVPVIYPFIVNDPGEGAQAKRRIAAVVVDHLMPPMARAESHGPAIEIERLIDEYAAAEAGDPRRAKRVASEIVDLVRARGFDLDMGLDLKADLQTSLAKLDEHICDLKELQIRDGLHILGEAPNGQHRAETLVAMARVPRGDGKAGDASLLRALADDLELGFDPLDGPFGEPWGGPRPEALRDSLPPCGGGTGRGESRSCDTLWRTCGDTVERLEALALRLVSNLGPAPENGVSPYDPSPLPVPPPQGGRGKPPGFRSVAVLNSIANGIAPALDSSGAREIVAVLTALSGKFVAPGPSGAPTRGRADCLPTGRNFYSVDVRAVPTPAAWELGRRSADLLAERYFQDEGEWPRAIALTVWGTSNMRTGGDDIAQALALIGARPVWEGMSGRVTGIEIISLSELKRPRVDVTLRISGFFRDAFPSQISLFHEAVRAVAERDEPVDANPIAARIRADAKGMTEAGLGLEDATRAASFRVFGSKPGAYGAGLQALIDEGIWAERKDLAAAFLEWSAYAYGGGAEGEGARTLLETRLKATDAVVQNQDNREHDLLDADDYYQFEGGLAASVETLRGEAPRIFHNDHSRPERPVIRALDEEIARVVRGRAANPKWIAGVMRHGYKGAFEIAATVDYLFAFAATTNAVKHHHFEQLYDAYLGDAAVRGFIAENNAPALREIAERLREAVDRGLWAPRRNSTYEDLRTLLDTA